MRFSPNPDHIYISIEELDEFFKFALVGLIGTAINIVILYYFTEFLNMYYLASATLAFLVAVTSNFILNKIWTFK